MKTNWLQKWELPPTWLRFLLISILVLSLIFRFANLDQKVYTIDEVRGLLRISGYTNDEFVQQVFDGELIRVEDVQKYQRPNPEKKLGDAINALAGNPEHPPLYYLMARFCMQWFNNPAAARILAALLSLLVFPCLYWLCIELFNSSMTGWLAIILVASSPFHLMLAQEARQYTLWTVAILISSAALLRALRLKTKRLWGIYAAGVALGIYSHLFFFWVVIAHGFYVIFIENWRFSKTLRVYLLASFGGLFLFIPWILVVAYNLQILKEKTRWVAYYKASLITRFEYWSHGLSTIFLDFNSGESLKNPIPYLVLILVIYAIYSLCRQTPKRVWSFVLILIVVPMLGQVVPDLLWGGRRSLMGRYLTPSYLGIELAVAYLFMYQITAFSHHLRRQHLWKLVLAVVISVGILSCAASAQARDWWKGSSSINLQVAPFVNQAAQPLVVSDAAETFILPLSYLLNSKVQLQLFSKNSFNQAETELNNLLLSNSFSDLFIYCPSKNLRLMIEKDNRYKMEQLVGESKFMKGTFWLYKIVER